MDETSKSREIWSDLEKQVFQGKGIDIGCGPDPVTDTARHFDIEHGDANHITQYVSDSYDYVYSSHCLEHMLNPVAALSEWWQLVKPGGHLFFTVPDEDLYEQGFFPSLFNPDHKSTFTIEKESSWSPVSYNVRALAAGLSKGKVILLRLQDDGYDRSLRFDHSQRPSWMIHKTYNAYSVLKSVFKVDWVFLDPWLKHFHPIDQTRRKGTLAQIQCIVQKQP